MTPPRENRHRRTVAARSPPPPSASSSRPPPSRSGREPPPHHRTAHCRAPSTTRARATTVAPASPSVDPPRRFPTSPGSAARTCRAAASPSVSPLPAAARLLLRKERRRRAQSALRSDRALAPRTPPPLGRLRDLPLSCDISLCAAVAHAARCPPLAFRLAASLAQLSMPSHARLRLLMIPDRPRLSLTKFWESSAHGTPSPPVHTLPPQHGFIPSSSHHSTSSPPADVYRHEHGIRPSSSHHATPSPSGHPAHSPGAGDEHTSTSRRPSAPHRHSSVRSSNSRLRSSIPQLLEEIPDFFRPPIAPTDGENPLTYLIVFFTWDLPMSFVIYDAWCRRASIRYMGNIYLIAKKRIAPIYLTKEVFEHYKRMRATDEAFKKKSERMSSNRKSEVGGSGTGISLHSAGSISARQHGDMLEKKLQRRPTWKEMFRHLHTHGHDGQSFVDQRSAKIDTPDTSIDEDDVYLEVVPEVKGRVYGLGSQGYHRSISLGGASSSRGPVYGLHELEELQRDHQRLQETLLKERMERQEQMQRDKMEYQEETREMQDRLARMEALLMQHLGIRPHVPPTPGTPPSPGTKRSGPQSDDHPGHLTTEITPS
ncbi:hypothetical protein Syun_027680 [Stephania yunnanensis]|uniref:Uncharacterized protein n=1 Tax=Stephania yunnanensis TaxID=152371 RepID=A0AAP0EPX1_9MAGN